MHSTMLEINSNFPFVFRLKIPQRHISYFKGLLP